MVIVNFLPILLILILELSSFLDSSFYQEKSEEKAKEELGKNQKSEVLANIEKIHYDAWVTFSPS